MQEDLIIFGGGGTGREIEQLVRRKYNVLGFFDDKRTGPDVIGRFDNYKKIDGHVKFCSSMSNHASMLRRKNFLQNIPPTRFITFIDTDTRIYSTAKWGNAVFVFPGSLLSNNVVLGNYILIYHHCVIAHDVLIQDYSVVANSVTISGGVTIGRNCYIGAGATILDNISIGDNCIIAAGSTVVSSVESNQIYIAPHRIKYNHYL